MAIEKGPTTQWLLHMSTSNHEDLSRRWIEMVLGFEIPGDYQSTLQDGVILCLLINQLYKALGLKHMTIEESNYASTLGSDPVKRRIWCIQAFLRYH